jgi:hypothetical protein
MTENSQKEIQDPMLATGLENVLDWENKAFCYIG